MLIIVGPVEPALDRLYIGRTFCVVVLAGLGSMTGTLAAGLILGISESIVLMHARRLLGAGGGLRPAADRAGHPAARTVRPMKYWIGAALVVARRRSRAPALVRRSNEYFFFAGYIVLHVRGARHRVEHPRRLRRLRELRHRRVLRPGRLHARWCCSRRSTRRSSCRSLAGAAIGAAARLRRRACMTLRLRGIFFAIATVARSCSSWRR